ncbi:MAG TPA: fumarylacetoacetate hydrolase family protein [Ktedonobacteraceae bacterium]|nr:fumarylacetoacetate hydrolase family protein [Ktedonobacteraceae bacterium]
MKLALFNGNRLGVVVEERIYDATAALPYWDNQYAANWWLRLCKDFTQLRPAIEATVSKEQGVPLSAVKLNAAALHPQKIIAAASNYAAHIQEMRDRAAYEAWLLEFGVFLKAPSAIIGPEDTIELPDVGDAEIHHESELGLIIGKTGKNISEEQALDYVLGYTGVLDITVRGSGDRSSRKSYDGFAPIGPWMVTADEIGDPHRLGIKLWLNGREELPRQNVNSGDMLVKIPAMIAYISRIMTLNPGDVITTGAPPGVGKIVSGDVITFEIEKIGRMNIYVR